VQVQQQQQQQQQRSTKIHLSTRAEVALILASG
jgi:hypothetical protein